LNECSLPVHLARPPILSLATIQRPLGGKNSSTPDLLSGLMTDLNGKGNRKEVIKEKVRGLMKHLRTSSRESDKSKEPKKTVPQTVEIIRMPIDAFSPTQTLCGQEFPTHGVDKECPQPIGASLQRRPRTQTKTSGRSGCSGRRVYMGGDACSLRQNSNN
jgi:hypothetical protein